MRLCSKVVELIRFNSLDNTDQIGGIRQIAVMENKIPLINVWILIQVYNPPSIEAGASSFFIP